MGKVGSASVFDAIRRSLRRSLEKQEQDGHKGTRPREIGRTILIHSHEYRDCYGVLYGSIILLRVRLGLPVKIVCPIRDPIARGVSGFFWNIVKLNIVKKNPNADLGELKELFLSLPGKRVGVNWFDKQFRFLTRIDVYKKPFPIDRKWQIYRRGFTQVLVYRNDLKRSEQAKLVSRFLGIKLDEMRPIHAADNENYAELYSRFRESVKLPEWYIRQMHDSRFAQHFWSPEELKVAADKWRGAPSS